MCLFSAAFGDLGESSQSLRQWRHRESQQAAVGEGSQPGSSVEQRGLPVRCRGRWAEGADFAGQKDEPKTLL